MTAAMRLYSPRIMANTSRPRTRPTHTHPLHTNTTFTHAQTLHTHTRFYACKCAICVCVRGFFFGLCQTGLVSAAWSPVSRLRCTCSRSTLYSKTHLSDFMAPFKWLLNLPNVKILRLFRSLSRGVSHKFGLTRCHLNVPPKRLTACRTCCHMVQVGVQLYSRLCACLS